MRDPPVDPFEAYRNDLYKDEFVDSPDVTLLLYAMAGVLVVSMSLGMVVFCVVFGCNVVLKDYRDAKKIKVKNTKIGKTPRFSGMSIGQFRETKDAGRQKTPTPRRGESPEKRGDGGLKLQKRDSESSTSSDHPPRRTIVQLPAPVVIQPPRYEVRCHHAHSDETDTDEDIEMNRQPPQLPPQSMPQAIFWPTKDGRGQWIPSMMPGQYPQVTGYPNYPSYPSPYQQQKHQKHRRRQQAISDGSVSATTPTSPSSRSVTSETSVTSGTSVPTTSETSITSSTPDSRDLTTATTSTSMTSLPGNSESAESISDQTSASTETPKKMKKKKYPYTSKSGGSIPNETYAPTPKKVKKKNQKRKDKHKRKRRSLDSNEITLNSSGSITPIVYQKNIKIEDSNESTLLSAPATPIVSDTSVLTNQTSKSSQSDFFNPREVGAVPKEPKMSPRELKKSPKSKPRKKSPPPLVTPEPKIPSTPMRQMYPELKDDQTQEASPVKDSELFVMSPKTSNLAARRHAPAPIPTDRRAVANATSYMAQNWPPGATERPPYNAAYLVDEEGFVPDDVKKRGGHQEVVRRDQTQNRDVVVKMSDAPGTEKSGTVMRSPFWQERE